MPGRRRLHFRSPGVKPGQRIGPLGPFRGRLGVHWVIAPLVLAVVLLAAGWYFLAGAGPGEPWRAVASADAIQPGSARAVGGGIFVARLPDGRAVGVAQEPGCPLEVRTGGGYADCDGAAFDLNGIPSAEGTLLDLVPIRMHRGEIYVDPSRRIERSSSPAFGATQTAPAR